MKFLLELQNQIESNFGKLNQAPGQLIGTSPVYGLEQGEASNQGPGYGNAPEGSTANVLKLIALLRLKLEQLGNLLSQQQNTANALTGCQNALASGYPAQLQFVNGLAPQCQNELQGTPYQLSMCNNMMSNLRQQLPSGLYGSVPEQEIPTRYQILQNIGNGLYGQSLVPRQGLVMQHVNQLQSANGQPVQFNLYNLANQPYASECLQQQLGENNVNAIVQSRMPQQGTIQLQIQRFVNLAAQTRPKLENYLIRVAQIQNLIPTASAQQLPTYQLQLTNFKNIANNLQGQFTSAKNCANALQQIGYIQQRLANIASNPNEPENLESAQGSTYPSQLTSCAL